MLPDSAVQFFIFIDNIFLGYLSERGDLFRNELRYSLIYMTADVVAGWIIFKLETFLQRDPIGKYCVFF